jgi:hypothetical protein
MDGISRRQVIAGTAGVLAVAGLGIAPAQAANNAQDLIKAFTGGKAATEGKVKLDLPEIAENGNTVASATPLNGVKWKVATPAFGLPSASTSTSVT